MGSHVQPQTRFYLETYGCQMNIADSELVHGVMARAGFRAVERPDDADIVLLNTCAIRENAEERVLGRLSDLARLKSKRPNLRLGLLGCMAQHNRANLVEKAPYLDLVAGPDSYRRLPELIDHSRFDPTVDVRLDRSETYADFAPVSNGSVRAYLSVMRGCDKFCAFCVVPYVRGRERSLPLAAVLDQLKQLARDGTKEVVLLGQTVNAYRDGDSDFGDLLRQCASVEGIERIRFTSPHPSDMTDSVIDAMASELKVQPYLHLPLQSGSDRVLSAMDRGYSVAEYMTLVETLRERIPQLAMSTDIIVGFHGESDSDFEGTLELMRQVRYDSAFTFKYSLREHTKAFARGDTVSEEEKSRRLTEVIRLQQSISLERNRENIGHTYEVLVEGRARRGEGMVSGKTPQFKTAVFPGDPRRSGQNVMVRIESATGHTLMGAAV